MADRSENLWPVVCSNNSPQGGKPRMGLFSKLKSIHWVSLITRSLMSMMITISLRNFMKSMSTEMMKEVEALRERCKTLEGKLDETKNQLSESRAKLQQEMEAGGRISTEEQQLNGKIEKLTRAMEEKQREAEEQRISMEKKLGKLEADAEEARGARAKMVAKAEEAAKEAEILRGEMEKQRQSLQKLEKEVEENRLFDELLKKHQAETSSIIPQEALGEQPKPA